MHFYNESDTITGGDKAQSGFFFFKKKGGGD